MEVDTAKFFAEYKGHPTKELEKVIQSLKKHHKSMIYFIGDSTLDNKHWLFSSPESKLNLDEYHNDKISGDAINGYENVLIPPRQIKDVAYWVNNECMNRKMNVACVNTSVEESTLCERANGLLSQDALVQKYLTEDDYIVVSVGGNDIVNFPTWSTILSLVGLMATPMVLFRKPIVFSWQIFPWWNFGFSIPLGLSHLVGLLKNDIETLIRTIIGERRPRKILVCGLYHPDENTTVPGWGNKAFSWIGYDTHPHIAQMWSETVFREATSKISIEGCTVVPVPSFMALDGKTTSDYIQRAEPSVTGGEKLARLIVDCVLGNPIGGRFSKSEL